MCLLLVLSRLHPDVPLAVGANRDEQLDRPAAPMVVLDDRPRILGGRDEQAGGTWLAVNEHGVVAGLTNRPLVDGPATGKRSRGELPLALAGHPTAAAAIEDFERRFRPGDYNPSWLIVGDRTELYGVDMTGDDRPLVEALAPGVHVLENRPLGAASPKATHVRALLDGAADLDPEALVARLQAVLADHTIPPGPSAGAEAGRKDVPPEVGAACVHTERYGTRWSCVVTVDDDPGHRPGVVYADGPACGGGFRDAGPMWEGEQPGRGGQPR